MHRLAHPAYCTLDAQVESRLFRETFPHHTWGQKRTGARPWSLCRERKSAARGPEAGSIMGLKGMERCAAGQCPPATVVGEASAGVAGGSCSRSNRPRACLLSGRPLRGRIEGAGVRTLSRAAAALTSIICCMLSAMALATCGVKPGYSCAHEGALVIAVHHGTRHGTRQGPG